MDSNGKDGFVVDSLVPDGLSGHASAGRRLLPPPSMEWNGSETMPNVVPPPPSFFHSIPEALVGFPGDASLAGFKGLVVHGEALSGNSASLRSWSRKRNNEDMEIDHVVECRKFPVDTRKDDHSQPNCKVEQSGTTLATTLNKTSGCGRKQKAARENSESPREGFVHVRAKRGQATNSHSLAERARREKISERMRFLQELVPGCSKVTGKAVMLDEIINYVQSLQRQVEFLTMKLAAVNPCLDFSIEGLLDKDFLHSRLCSPAAIGFSHDMIQPLLYTSQHGLFQHLGIPGILNPDSQGMAVRSETSQVPSMWGGGSSANGDGNDDELCHPEQTALGGTNPHLDTHDPNGKLSDGGQPSQTMTEY